MKNIHTVKTGCVFWFFKNIRNYSKNLFDNSRFRRPEFMWPLLIRDLWRVCNPSQVFDSGNVPARLACPTCVSAQGAFFDKSYHFESSEFCTPVQYARPCRSSSCWLLQGHYRGNAGWKTDLSHLAMGVDADSPLYEFGPPGILTRAERRSARSWSRISARSENNGCAPASRVFGAQIE